MIRVQFNDSVIMKNAEFKLISDQMVQLSGKGIKPLTSGFKIFRLNGKLIGDYSDYTNIVSEGDDFIQFSKPIEY